MEVFTLFTSNRSVLSAFDAFIFNYNNLDFSSKDNNTVHFNLKDKNEIYYHYLLNDNEVEFSYNYSENDIAAIRLFFGKKDFYSFDLSYRRESFVRELLIDFKNYLSQKSKALEKEILLSHPHLGLMTLSSIT